MMNPTPRTFLAGLAAAALAAGLSYPAHRCRGHSVVTRPGR
jgi:hypothetical protein